MRSPLQGTRNVVRFNWPFYAAAGVAVAGGLALRRLTSKPTRRLLDAALWTGGLVTANSLLATYWIYDASGFYELDWLDAALRRSGGGLTPKRIINLNAGFDELTRLLRRRFPTAKVVPADFYDPALHTEPSIARARATYPSPSDTLPIKTGDAAEALGPADLVVAGLSIHEVRDAAQRIALLRQLGAVTGSDGRLVIVEHLLDLPNTLAYTIGVGHFHARRTWQRSFDRAGLALLDETKWTPFLRIFTLAAT